MRAGLPRSAVSWNATGTAIAGGEGLDHLVTGAGAGSEGETHGRLSRGVGGHGETALAAVEAAVVAAHPQEESWLAIG
jgi:hypothetical protein